MLQLTPDGAFGERRSLGDKLAKRDKHGALANTVRLIQLLRGRRRGLRVRRLVDELGVGRSSVYRYLASLEQGQVPIRRENRNGEAWVVLDEVAGDLTDEQLWAIAVARRLLRGLEGTPVATALDRLVAGVGDVKLDVRPPAPHDSVVAARVIDAIRRRRRLAIRYRGLRDEEPRERVIEPVGLHVAAGAWYLTAFDVGADEPRTFKLARFTSAAVTSERVAERDVDVERIYAQSVAVWCGDPVAVAVRLTGEAARFVDEYPLHPQQVVERDGDGVVVRATVAGLEEVTRWVLRWGRSALALEPRALVARVRSEIDGAAAAYGAGSSDTSGHESPEAALVPGRLASSANRATDILGARATRTGRRHSS